MAAAETITRQSGGEIIYTDDSGSEIALIRRVDRDVFAVINHALGNERRDAETSERRATGTSKVVWSEWLNLVCQKSRQQALHITRDQLGIRGPVQVLAGQNEARAKRMLLERLELCNCPIRQRHGVLASILGVGGRNRPALSREIKLVLVGYESASQFSREYSRLFGAPPQQDARRMRLAS